jgi:CheY-like chemotaxis protein
MVSGFELQQRGAVPVIFITAHDDALTLERITRARAAGHLRKPIDAPAVLNEIRTAVNGPDQRLIGPGRMTPTRVRA